MSSTEKIAVIGLGYVGLPVALAFARTHPGTVAFDIDATRVAELKSGIDRTREVPQEVLDASEIVVTADATDLRGATFFVVTGPIAVGYGAHFGLGLFAPVESIDSEE